MKIALLAGATGLIGKQLLELLLADPEYHQVKAISRRPLKIDNPKLVNLVIEFSGLANSVETLRCDTVFCCLGTTMKQAKTKEAFRNVDFDYPLELAKIARTRGAKQYHLVSALGADTNSSIYYNRVKGEIEHAITNTGFESLHIFRPSLLLGPREENRAGEDAAKVFYRLFGFLIPKKYQAIDSLKIAKAMVHFARQEEEGKFIHEAIDLQSF